MQEKFIKLLTENVPYNAKVEVKGGHAGQGWCMKDPEPWVRHAFDQCGLDFFDGTKVASYGMGGSIPFLAELGKMYTKTNIYALGVLGPQSNAHAPDESINLAYTKKITCSVSHLIAAVGQNK
jgi:acetylornithine deacetylase/succinyl-diaminopimelate desuccinylase-like protein